jgi:protein gp37
MSKTAIEWATDVWNPIRGCRLVSAGCTHCYAMRQAHRFSGPGQPYDGLTTRTEHGPVWTGEVRLVPELLDQPLRWKKPRRIFVNSMSDLFHPDVPDEFICRVFEVMTACNGYYADSPSPHIFQILTKRPERQREFMGKWIAAKGHDWLREHGHRVWLGVSVEDQKTADERIPILLRTPAAVRWVSAEPLLGPIDLGEYLEGDQWMASEEPMDGWLDWVVVGGESGPGARPCGLAWVRSIVAQCRTANTPLFVKQLGAAASDPLNGVAGSALHIAAEAAPLVSRRLRDRKGGDPSEWPHDLQVREYPT